VEETPELRLSLLSTFPQALLLAVVTFSTMEDSWNRKICEEEEEADWSFAVVVLFL
jgi:hypothetical protein